MKDASQSNLIRFINITKKKDGMFVNFKAKGVKGGAAFTASIAVDIAAADVDPADPLEKIVEGCAKIAVREFKTSELSFEGLPALHITSP